MQNRKLLIIIAGLIVISLIGGIIGYHEATRFRYVKNIKSLAERIYPRTMISLKSNDYNEAVVKITNLSNKPIKIYPADIEAHTKYGTKKMSFLKEYELRPLATAVFDTDALGNPIPATILYGVSYYPEGNKKKGIYLKRLY
jgi:hypothetical protein